MAKNRLRVIPLGGSGEVGRNMWVLEYGEEIVLLDCGVMFPEAEMLGASSPPQKRQGGLHAVRPKRPAGLTSRTMAMITKMIVFEASG